MAGVSTEKIVLQSTLDPKGFVDLKNKLNEIRSGGGGGGGGQPPPAPPPAPAAPRSGGAPAAALSRIAGSVPGGQGLAGIIGEAGAGPVAAALAVYATSQIAAQSAQELRRNNREAGITSETYGRLAASSRSVGVGIEETIAGIKRATAAFEATALHGDAGEALFLRSLGLSDSQINRGLDNADTMLATLRGKKLNDVQKTALFGSIAAADAAMNPGGGSFLAPTAGESRNARQLASGAGDAGVKAAGTWGSILKAALNDPLRTALDPVNSTLDQMNKDQREATAEEQRQRKAYAQVRRAQAAFARSQALLTPEESYAQDTFAIGNAEFTDPKFRGRANLQAGRQLQNARSGLQSRAENLSAEIGLSRQEWDAFAGDPVSQRFAARGLGDKLSEAVGGMTAAGGQVGANDINTAAGASMVMGSEYQMSQSQQTFTLMATLLQELVNQGKLSQDQADATRNQIGFRYADPISSIFGNH